MKEKRLSIVLDILSWTDETDQIKLYYIQSYLLGWTSAETIERITESKSAPTSGKKLTFRENLIESIL